MAASKKSKSAAVDGLFEKAQADISSAANYMTEYKETWSQAGQMYRGERVNIGYQSQMGQNLSDPMTYNNIETNIANTFGSKPRMMYLPTRLEQQIETRALNQMADYTWDKNDMSLEIIPFGRELFITGNATFWSTWDYETDWIKTERKSINDCLFDPNATSYRNWRFAGYRYLTTKDEAKQVKRYDAESDEWVPKYDPNMIDKIPTWTNGQDGELDKEIKDCYEGSQVDGEAKKDQFEIVLLYYVKGKYAGKVIEVANRTLSLYEGDSVFQKKGEKRKVHCAQFNEDGTPKTEPDNMPDGTPNPKAGQPVFKMEEQELPEIKPFVPVAFQRNTIDGSLLFGIGEVEPNADNQELLNDTITQKRDNVTQNINSMILVDPKFKSMIPVLKNVPNAVYALPPGAVEFVQKPDMTGAADLEIQRIKESMRNTAAIDEVTAGLAPEHRSTATQITQQLGQANQRFSIKLQGLENEAFKQLADIWFKLFRIFVTEEQVIRVAGRKGVEWLKLDPDMYWGEYEPKVTLDQNAKQMRDDEIKRIEGVANILMNNPYVDQKELTRIVTTRLLEYDDDEADSLIVKDSDLVPQGPPQGQPQGQVPPGMGAMPMGPQQSGPQMPGVPNMPNGQLPANPVAMAALAKALGSSSDNQGPKTIQERIIESIDYADLPEDAKQQVLSQQLGINSSMASPTQQDFNLKAMQIQHDQRKQDLVEGQAMTKAALDAHSALLQTADQQHKQALDVSQHTLDAQNQGFTQDQQTQNTAFEHDMAKREAKAAARNSK